MAGKDSPPSDLVSIGHLAEATGISIDTIRAWERRYGRPIPHRLPSGHRRYAREDITWLRKVAEGLSRGHRPSKLVKLEPAELDDLLRGGPEEPDLEGRLNLVRSFKSQELRADLEAELLKLGIRAFLRDVLGPLVTSVGRAWADGMLEIRHEHFLTELLEDLLRQQRNLLPRSPDGIRLVLSSLVGEPHALGLQMAAVYAVLAGTKVQLLGPDMPISEIVLAANENEADVVAISVSLASGGVKTDRLLADLRKSLPENIHLVVGGHGSRGVRRGVRGVRYLENLDDFEAWLRELGTKRKNSRAS